MPEFRDIPAEISKLARDAAYVAIGLGVLGYQRAQTERDQLKSRLAEPYEQLEERADSLRDSLGRLARDVDDSVVQTLGRLEAKWEPIEERLPVPARALVSQCLDQARQVQRQISERFGQAA